MDLVESCLFDLQNKLSSIADLNNRVFSVVSESDLMDTTRALPYPCAGVVFEGLSAASSPEKQGMSCILQAGIYLLLKAKALSRKHNRFSDAVSLLSLFRSNIRMTKAPSGHNWVYSSEVFDGERLGSLIYVQRWTTRLIITN